MSTKLIDEYRYFISDGIKQKAYISCWKGGAFQGYIEFYEAGEVPKPSINSNGSLRLPYDVQRLEAILTTLREESPVYIQVKVTTNYSVCRVSTSNEPIGEEEGH